MLGIGHLEWDPTRDVQERTDNPFLDEDEPDEEVRYEEPKDIEDEDDGEQKGMDLDEEEQAADETFIPFPSPTQPTPHLEWKGSNYRYTEVPESLAVLLPTILKGMAVIKDITVRSKLTASVQNAMPMPIHTSPLLALLAQKTTQDMWKPRYTGWMMSCFQLHQYYHATIHFLMPFHPSVKPEMIEKEKKRLSAQTNALIMQQEDTIDALLAEILQAGTMRRDFVNKFIQILEAYSFNYVHLYEKFLYTLLVAPHTNAIKLEDVLTPHDLPSLDQCDKPYDVRQQVVDFFQIKVPAIDKRIQEQDEFAPNQSITLQQLPYRIEVHKENRGVRYNCPPDTVYRGYIDLLTVEEYLRYVDREGKLANIPFLQ